MSDEFDVESGSGDRGWLVNHLPFILWQRRYLVIVPFVLLSAAAVIAAYSLPTLYRSSAQLMIESQSLPRDVATSQEGAAINQRIGRIRERVLSRSDLIAIIEQNALYPDLRRSQPISEVIERMRESTTIEPLNNDIGKASGGQSNIIAINMSFDYPDPVMAQTVLQSFASSFLRIDSDAVADQASLTLRFLDDQASTLQAQISQIENELTILKSRNGAALAGSGFAAVDTGSYTAQIVSLENQNRQLAIESRTAGTGVDPVTQAEAALAAARATYSDSHPDVARARQRLEAVRQAAGSISGSSLSDGVMEQIRANNDAIATLRAARDSATARANAAMAGQARAPAIEERAMQLQNRANGLREQLKTVSEDLLKARTNARLSDEQRGERLTLIDPASLPDTPYSPNRPLLIAGGAVAGLLLGLLLAFAAEFMRRPIRSPVQIEGRGFPVLGVVPIIQSAKVQRPFSFRILRRNRA